MIIFDIETYKDDDEPYLAYKSTDVKAPSNYKDEAKIESYIQEEIKKRNEKFALDPLTGKVILIGLITNNIPPNFVNLLKENNALTKFNLRPRDENAEFNFALDNPGEFCDPIYVEGAEDDIWYYIQLGLNGMSESNMLGAFWELVQYDLLQDKGKLIGYNSSSFDIPFLIKRSIINKIPKTISFKMSNLTAKYNNQYHLDIYKALDFGSNPYTTGSLIDWQYKLGGTSLERDGAKIKIWYENNEFLKIIEKNIQDLFQTKKVYEGMYEWLK